MAEASLPSHFRLIYNSTVIAERAEELGRQIEPWVRDSSKRTGAQVLAVCVLRGAVFFFSDLLRQIESSVEPNFCRAWSYSSQTNERNAKGVGVSVEQIAASGRAILIVDDICDTGSTLAKLETVFCELGAAEVRSAVLIHRKVPGTQYRPSWSGFEYSGDEWFVGYGLDDRNRYRNLPSVYCVNPD